MLRRWWRLFGPSHFFLCPCFLRVRSFVRSFLARSFACTLVLHSSAFWELAPYIPGATAANVEAQCKPFMIENAGKAFEFMTDSCNEERKAAGLPPIAEARGNATGGAIDAALAAVVDGHRAKFGLPPLAEANAGATSGEGSEEAFLQLQKDETVAALGKCARANAGVVPTLVDLQAGGVKYSIATTSGKPRVPVCVDAASLRPFFPPDKIHSGESDFDPPKFKPAPDVYLRAAAGEGKNPAACVAVEDSASGVGSAANAGCGLIVGYVGATHIPAERKDSHAKMLMEGKRADDGRGAEVVISELQDLLPIVAHFNACYQASEAAAGFLPLPESLTQSFKGPFWVRS